MRALQYNLENILSGEYPMKPNVLLTTASLLSILFVTLHTADDIVRGMEPGTLSDLIVMPILVLWLYGTLVLADRGTSSSSSGRSLACSSLSST
jgi:hypothetical protein